jgi:flagellar biosynthetic protein FlhB
VALAVLFDAAGAWWAGGLSQALREVLATCGISEWTLTHTSLTGKWMGAKLLLVAGTAAITVLGFTLLIGIFQTGFRLTTTPLQFNWSRLAWSQGWNKLCSPESAVKTLSVLIKLALISLVAGWAAIEEVDRVRVGPFQRLSATVAMGSNAISRVLWSAAAGAIAIGLADVAWQRWRREQRLRMSRTELKQEQKEDGGDPQVRGRIRKMQREVARRKGLRDVPGATVVLTNPTHYAVALKYERTSSAAPRVIAKGSGPLARLIIRIAKSSGVPVLERKPLARALYRHVDVGKEIPSEFYQAVAEILAFLYRQRRAG